MKKQPPHLILSLIVAAMLLLALADLPYGYYQLLRFCSGKRVGEYWRLY